MNKELYFVSRKSLHTICQIKNSKFLIHSLVLSSSYNFNNFLSLKMNSYAHELLLSVSKSQLDD